MRSLVSLAAVAALLLASSASASSPPIVADPAYVPNITNPTYDDPNTAPVVLFDTTRSNVDQRTTRFKPLADLLEADGYNVSDLTEPMPDSLWQCLLAPEGCPYLEQLSTANVVVIGQPAVSMSAAEVAELIYNGHVCDIFSSCPYLGQAFLKSLLIVTENPPSMADVAAALGVTLTPRQIAESCGAGCVTNKFTFTAGNGLASHVVASGHGGTETVTSVVAFGGPAAASPTNVYPTEAWQPILTLPSDAYYTITGTQVSAAGQSQLLAIEAGPQRIVLATEEAILTALAQQVTQNGVTTYPPVAGFQLAEALQNQQFALNLMHWLDGSLRAVTAGVPYPGCTGQCADISFVPSVSSPVYASGTGPRVLVDSAHNNFHTIVGSNPRYLNFQRLLEADGYVVADNPLAFTDPAFQANLPNVDVVVVANATSVTANAPNALSSAEVTAILNWVRGGGSLWLIADHPPYSPAYANLASALGIAFANCTNGGVSTTPTTCAPWMQTCRTSNYAVRAASPASWEGTLSPTHSVVVGRSPAEHVDWVQIFTGTTVTFTASPPADATYAVVGTTSPTATFVPSGGGSPVSAAGSFTALAIQLGQGRVFVATEAGGLTAQVIGTDRFGMSVPQGRFNQQYVLNTAHWLTGVLP